MSLFEDLSISNALLMVGKRNSKKKKTNEYFNKKEANSEGIVVTYPFTDHATEVFFFFLMENWRTHTTSHGYDQVHLISTSSNLSVVSSNSQN